MTGMAQITSHSNPRIKQFRALRRRKIREETGLCVVEGIFHVGEALAAAAANTGVSIDYLCYAPELLGASFGAALVEQARERGVPVFETTADILTAAAEKENPQGLLAVVRPRPLNLDHLHPLDCPKLVALVSPQDPGNVGTILRTIDATGASGLILLDDAVDPYHPTAIRASMGAIFWRPVVAAAYTEFTRWSHEHGVHIYGTSAKGSIDYREAIFTPPLVLLMGSERTGLTAEQTAGCEALVSLPMSGRVSSLNLAVATSVILYEIAAQLPK